VLVEQPAFCLGRTEVTRGAVTPGEPHPDAELPAELAYSEAKAYCEARGLRLPTQDEWRYAAVEASDFLFPWGDELPPDGVCWLLGPASKPCMVGRSARDVTPEGIHDMAANVREWVHVPAHVEPGEPWIPYDMIGEAHDTTCSELSLGGKLRLKGGGSNVAPQERAGFRCASSGRLRPGAGEAPR
jgi:formylglycine-generating enzyme required for sulfatase activity